MNIKGFDKSDITEKLIERSLSVGRFPHAVIIEGGSSDDRIDLAKRISLALVCEDESSKPCGECSDCRKASMGFHPDILIHQPKKKETSKNVSYYVEYVREIRDMAYIIPNEANVKIIILEEAQLMNEAGQNAFLKILEEPPGFTVFMLLTSTKSVFLPTILSRAAVYSLGGEVSEDKDEAPKYAAESVACALTSDNHFDLVIASAVFDKNQKLLADSLPIMNSYFVEALKIKYRASDDENYPEVCETLAKKLSKRTLLRLCDHVNTLSEALKQNANLNLTIARMCALFKSASLEQE